MEIPRERPPDYVSTNPDELRLPSVPRHEIGSTSPQQGGVTLPSFHSVFAGIPQDHALREEQLAKLSSSLNHNGHEHSRFGTQYRSNVDPSVMSPTETGSVMSADDGGNRSTSVVSLEDPDVRIAAEALSGLGRPVDHIRSGKRATQDVREGSQEPLLRMLVEAHPWVGGTIEGSLSAYNSTKGFTPRFVQNSASYLERTMGNTVSSVGRRTGVEDGIRRYLDSRRGSDLERGAQPASGFRQKPSSLRDGDMDLDDNESAIDDSPLRAREYLPAYRSSKPPSYREEVSPEALQRQQLTTRPPHNRSWSTKIMISTSGLGVALSDTSLKSLKFCVGYLEKATEHVKMILDALKMVLRDWDQLAEHQRLERAQYAKEVEAGMRPAPRVENDDATRRLADRIQHLCAEMMRTIGLVVETVSKYTGAALPENARRLVKGQVLSLPRRWRAVTESVDQEDGANAERNGDSATSDAPRKAAHRMIVFATEGLDVMGQVNGVVQWTLKSAEDWLDTFGRRHRLEGEGSLQPGHGRDHTREATPTAGAEQDSRMDMQ